MDNTDYIPDMFVDYRAPKAPPLTCCTASRAPPTTAGHHNLVQGKSWKSWKFGGFSGIFANQNFDSRNERQQSAGDNDGLQGPRERRLMTKHVRNVISVVHTDFKDD